MSFITTQFRKINKLDIYFYRFTNNVVFRKMSKGNEASVYLVDYTIPMKKYATKLHEIESTARK